MKVLLVTNDFPPRVGGIQSYLWNLYSALSARGIEVRVLAPRFPGDAAFDGASGVEVRRFGRAIAWPSRALQREIETLAKDVDVVTFGAVLPMNLLASRVDRPVVVHTHGFEVAWARLPALRQGLRRIAHASAVFTVVSDYTRGYIERAIGARTRLEMLRTGVDLDRFHPGVDAAVVRKRHGLEDRLVISCVSRLVSRKGQDMLIEALPRVRRALPDAALLITGGGPARARLERAAGDGVVFAGQVPEGELAAHYAAGDVFAMPCRSRFADLEVEGLGLVYLEAQACARPAITGDSGGAPEAVRPGETGWVAPGRDPRALADVLIGALQDPARARSMGNAGRAFVEREHRWDDVVSRLELILRAAR